MKHLLMALLFSFTLNAQPTTSSCCPIADKVDDVIKDDHVATSCLICNEIELNSYENLLEFAGPEVDATESASIEKALKDCHNVQSDIIQNIYAVIKEYRIISKDKKINHLSQVVSGTMLLANIQIAQSLKQVDPEGLIKLGECSGKEMTQQEILQAQLKVIIHQLSNIKKAHKKMTYRCVGYYPTNNEEKMIKLINELEILDEYSNEN
jgi:hypothetical protein